MAGLTQKPRAESCVRSTFAQSRSQTPYTTATHNRDFLLTVAKHNTQRIYLHGRDTRARVRNLRPNDLRFSATATDEATSQTAVDELSEKDIEAILKQAGERSDDRDEGAAIRNSKGVRSQSSKIKSQERLQMAIDFTLEDAKEKKNVDEVYGQIMDFRASLLDGVGDAGAPPAASKGPTMDVGDGIKIAQTGSEQNMIVSFLESTVNTDTALEDRNDLLNVLSEEKSWDISTLDFLRIVVKECADVRSMVAIMDGFKGAYVSTKGSTIDAIVTTATKLTEDQENVVKQVVKTLTGVKQVALECSVDSSLESGYMLKYGSGSKVQIYDNTGSRYRNEFQSEMNRAIDEYVAEEWDNTQTKTVSPSLGCRMLAMMHNSGITEMCKKAGSSQAGEVESVDNLVTASCQPLCVDIGAELSKVGSKMDAVMADEGVGSNLIDPEKLMMALQDSPFLGDYDKLAAKSLEAWSQVPSSTSTLKLVKEEKDPAAQQKIDESIKQELVRIEQESMSEEAKDAGSSNVAAAST